MITRQLKESVISLVLSMSPFITRVPSSGRRFANFLKECLMSFRSLKKSRWSASILVITLIFGKKLRKLFVYSQASVTKYSDLPTLIFPPISLKIPPIERVGSTSASKRILASIEVVVVLPCVPLMAIGSSYSFII